jgi:signal transduction histidine kinase
VPQSPRLADLLALAADNRRLRAGRGGGQLEAELDILHRALAEQRAQEEERLRAQKLRALAEFAAGAGHEINNPLAVISGQAQYLLGHESDLERRKALETIVGQTRRIHQLLRDVMQFARPPAPHRQPLDLARVVEETAVALGEYAAERKVRLRVPLPLGPRPEGPLTVLADSAQLRTALTCLLRNAIEAAPADGWAGIRLLAGQGGTAEVVIEDSGQGLPPAQREHLFDPFYSGRAAGRGPGLGLPTAWSLARQQGGDVVLASLPGEPTRFVLRLPLHVEPSPALAG